ncbi:MAG: glycosyltransferase family 9 protein [Phocaeicola sp.]|uniref:glycosyltransferase family 9 protein n=1 Tax=Phocaeicola sp. TaxID=2773926 RepID=UPI003FA0C258
MKLLVIRFSALGDVAMTIPVIYSVANRYPDLNITVLSKQFVSPLFTNCPKNVTFRGIDLSQYKGINGLYRLFRELKKEQFDAVADLHDVLRSMILRIFFKLSGTQTAHIDKGRAEKKALTRINHKIIKPLRTSFEHYADVFKALGYPVEIKFDSIYKGKGDAELFKSIANLDKKNHWIGFAPFAAHKGKVLPIETVKLLIDKLAANPKNQIFLFGGGEKEKIQLEILAGDSEQVTAVAGKLKMNGELALMSYLDVLVSMDSANMHLASLVGTPVISIWGATHPYAGFMGWNQKQENAVQIDLPCRPCSIFGNKPCHRKDYACLYKIQTDTILQKINHIIES